MSPPTIISKRHVIAVVLLGIVLILSSRPWQAISNENANAGDTRQGPTTVNDESPVASPGFIEPTRTKSRIRTHHPKPTIEETKALLRTTIIPVLDLPADQRLPERIARINELIQKAGVEPHRLRLLLRSADPVNQLRFKDEMRIRDIPLGIALKYLIDSTKVRYRVRENGIIELSTLQYQDPMPDPPRKTVRPTSGETDPFDNDPNPTEGSDPFAELTPAH